MPQVLKIKVNVPFSLFDQSLDFVAENLTEIVRSFDDQKLFSVLRMYKINVTQIYFTVLIY